jgi:hypothetical protein
MIRWSYKTKKIYWNDVKELIRAVNQLGAKEIIEIKSGIPDITCTCNCSEVFYSYYF